MICEDHPFFLLEVIFQNVFSPKAPGPAAPSFWGKSVDLEVQGPLGDEVTYPKMSKIMKIKDLTTQCDQIGQARVPESCAPFRPLISFLSKPPQLPYGTIFSFRGGPYEFELEFEFPASADR